MLGPLQRRDPRNEVGIISTQGTSISIHLLRIPPQVNTLPKTTDMSYGQALSQNNSILNGQDLFFLFVYGPRSSRGP